MDTVTIEKAFAASTWGNRAETAEDWVNALESGDEAKRRRIFSILFREDAKSVFIHKIFGQDEIAGFVAEMTRPLWRADLERKRKIWRSVYCGEKNAVPELDWIRK